MGNISKNKYDFITDLLENKKLNFTQKERILMLANRELKKDFSSKKKIEERVRIIEEIINSEDIKIKIHDRNIIIEEKTSLFKAKEGQEKERHKPLDTKSFLSLFKNSKYLKYLTHRFNSKKPTYDSFLAGCKDEFDNAKLEFPGASQKLIRRVEEFVFREKPNWFITKGDKEIKQTTGWSEPSFVKWYNTSSIHPLDDAKWKSEMISPFKDTIEVRSGELPKIINEQLQLAFRDELSMYVLESKAGNLESAEFYTNVDILKTVIYRIFCQIKDFADKNFHYSIEIDFIDETLHNGSFKKLQITHKDSKPTRKADDPNFEKGDLIDIRNLLWGLANYEIEAKFINGSMRRIFSTDNNDEYNKYVKINQPLSLDREVNGFTHIIKFY